MKQASSMIELINPDPDKIIKALAEAYRVSLEKKTGQKIRVEVLHGKENRTA